MTYIMYSIPVCICECGYRCYISKISQFYTGWVWEEGGLGGRMGVGGVGGQDGYFSAHCVVNSDKLATVIAEF